MNITFSWSNSIGLARAMLAMGTLLTLLLNPTEVLFDPNVLNEKTNVLRSYSFFFLLKNSLLTAKLVACAILISVIWGIYPRFTGLLHWYVSYSFFAACTSIDGGDHITSVLSLLLVPLTLTDSRKSHWGTPVQATNTTRSFFARSFFVLIQLQVCVIYLHAFAGKLEAKEWLNGTATFYWLTHEYFGVNEIFRPLLYKALANPYIVTFFTWGILVVEFVLAAGILLDPQSKKRKYLLAMGISLHFGIFVIHGLASFLFATTAGLLLYLLPNGYQFNFAVLKAKLNAMRRKAKTTERYSSRQSVLPQGSVLAMPENS
jgi:antimicrobial peptide system SdpB family protein